MSIAARIASQPDKAGEVLQTIHKLGHCDKRQSLMQEFINAYRGSDQSVMISMISGDLSRRLMDVLLESHLCGYSIPQLTALPRAIEYDPREYISMILVLLNGCMQVFSHERVQCGMPHSLPPAARSHAIAIYQRMPQLWAVLWALKDPWISQWPQYYHPLYESWHILQNAICTVATRSLVLQVEYRQPRLTFENSLLPQLMFTIWIHSSRWYVIMPAFKALAAAVGPDGQTRPLEWKRFLATAATGTNARQYVGQAFLRDLRTDQFVDDDLMVTLNTLFAINSGTSNETGQYRFMGHEFILAGFAASRRQVCSGTKS